MQHSTGYIIGFAVAVCLVCALFVSSALLICVPAQGGRDVAAAAEGGAGQVVAHGQAGGVGAIRAADGVLGGARGLLLFLGVGVGGGVLDGALRAAPALGLGGRAAGVDFCGGCGV